MIQTIVTRRYPKCESKNMVKNGYDYKGSQKYHCKACGIYGTLHVQLECSEEQVILRGIERIF